MNNQKICRFCLHKDKIDYINIFNTTLTDLISKIEYCLTIQVTSNDNLPIFICTDCLMKINTFFEFKKTCYQSHEYLIELNDTNRIENDLNHTNLEEETEIFDGDEGDPSSEETFYENNKKIYKRLSRRDFNEVDDSVLQIIGDNFYNCGICYQTFESFIDYYDHQYKHDGELVFNCDKCDTIFNKRNLLVEHAINHKICCPVCKIEVLPKSLQAHLLIHTDIHKCTFCNMRHTSKASLEKHIQARHTKIKGFVCHICGKQNSCQSSMNRHMAYHSNARPHKCKYCDFSAKSLNIIQVHTARKHFAEKSVCEICAKIFKSQPSLVQHMKRIHSDRKHVCSICDKRFIERYNLSKHMKKHVGQRLHECKICQSEFFTVRKLKEHMHSHRQGCVNCFKCGKEFFYKKYLNKHILKCNQKLEGDFIGNMPSKIS